MRNMYSVWLASAALLLSSGFIWTTSAYADQIQVAEEGGVYRMPAGDHFTAADAVDIPQAVPRRSPTPEAELRRIKGSVAAASEGDPAPASSAPQGRALYKECVTNASTGFFPSDIHGAASPTNLVVVTNVNIGIFNKTTCAVVSNVSLKTFFGSSFTIPAAETLFDPRVVYDRLHARCIVTAESRNSGNTDQFLYVAMSTSSACTSWRRIRFVLSRVSTSSLFCKALASDFYDFPNLGYMGTRIVVTANHFPTAGGSHGSVLSINKSEMMSGAPVSGRCFRPVSTNTAPAIVSSSSVTQMFLLSTGSGSGSSLGVRRLNVGADTPNDTLSTLASIPIAAWTAPPDAKQPNLQELDTLDGRFQSATKQIGSNLFNVHAINSGGVSRARYYKLTTSSVVFSNTFFTTNCNSNQHIFNPSLDINSTATGTLVFITTSRTCPTGPAAGNASHLIFRGDNANLSGLTFSTVETSASQYATEVTSSGTTSCNAAAKGACRWGDYSSTQIDPSNTARAWGFNQLATGTTSANWNTRAGLSGP